MLECEFDEWVYLLLEWKIHADTHRFGFTGEIDTSVCGLHQSGPATGDDVATHFRQRVRSAFRFLVSNRSRLRSRRTENRHPIAISSRWLQAREVVNDVPKPKHRIDEDFLYSIFVGQAYGICSIYCIHCHPGLLSLRPSAYLCVLCVELPLTAEYAEIRKGPQRRPPSQISSTSSSAGHSAFTPNRFSSCSLKAFRARSSPCVTIVRGRDGAIT